MTPLLKPPPGAPIVVPAYDLKKTSYHPAGGQLLAGAAKVDITPPPGFPTGGDGPAGNLSRGYWMRLYARAYFLMDSQGHTIVLVSCDLFAMPGGLSATVARNAAEYAASTYDITVPPEAVVIAATHTHQGPGNFLSSRLYNQFAAKYGGFSRDLFDFFVRQISAAVQGAMDDALKTKSPAAIAVHTGNIPSPFQLNRSPRTFLLNWNARPLMDALNPPVSPAACRPDVETGEARDDWDLPDCPRLRATDPTMTVLEISRGGSTIGILVLFAVHPTVLDSGSPFYSPDFIGYAMARLERETPSLGIAGFFNGAEGDVVARRGRRDLTDVARLGDQLTEAVRSVLSPMGTPLENKLDANGDTIGPGGACESSPKIRFADAPLPGVAVLGGGESDRTGLYYLGWRNGVRDIARNGQGPKQPALDSPYYRALKFTDILAGPETFPQQLPVRYLQIGALSLGAVPAELSTATAAKVREQLGGHGKFEIIGLANEYISYVASPDEYGGQDYMAAQTMWGPWEGEVFACRMQGIAKPGNWNFPRSVAQQGFLPGLSPEEMTEGFPLGPSAVGEPRVRPDEEMERVLLSPDGAPQRGLPYFVWTETLPSTATDYDYTAVRTITIEVRQNGQWIPRLTVHSTPDDDRGANLLTVMTHSPNGNRRSWAAIWAGPLMEPVSADDEFRFHVVALSNQQFCSASFQVDLTGTKPPQPIPQADCGR